MQRSQESSLHKISQVQIHLGGQRGSCQLQRSHSPVRCHRLYCCRNLLPVPRLVMQMFAHSCVGIARFCSWVSHGVGTKPGRMLTSSQPRFWDRRPLICCSLAQDLPLLPRVMDVQTQSPCAQLSQDRAAPLGHGSSLLDLRRGQGHGKLQDICQW